MKKILLFLLTMFCVTNNACAQFFIVDTLKLNSSYQNLMQEPSNVEYQKAYFEAFPNSWKEFISTYQFVPDNKYDLKMSKLAEEQILAFAKLSSIPDATYCKKIINIAIGGRLDNGVSGYLRKTIFRKMHTQMNIIFTYLSLLRKGHQMEFWEFYWSTDDPNEYVLNEFLHLKIAAEKLFPEEVQIMCDAFKYFYNGVYCAC